MKTFFSFFLESTCACVFGSWPWPRAFLSLASRVSVLGKAVLGLGFFLCPWPWPWPRALCPRLHLYEGAICNLILSNCFQVVAIVRSATKRVEASFLRPFYCTILAWLFFVNPIQVSNEEERWHHVTLPASNAQMKRFLLKSVLSLLFL